jgi:hypothetical protein
MNRIFGKLVYIIVLCGLIAIAIEQADRKTGACPICGHDRHMEGHFPAIKTP